MLTRFVVQVEWSPDGRSLLFGTTDGDVHIFDMNGSFVVRTLFPWQCGVR